MGSPPHTRGQVRLDLPCASDVRITPAHAGTSAACARTMRSSEDHPRTRGDKKNRRLFGLLYRGSPPHTRGQDFQPSRTMAICRITPAHAGTRHPLGAASRLSRDHPRTRGDKTFFDFAIFFIIGSPPHTRGQGIASPSKVFAERITPAHAGTRLKKSRKSATFQT